MGYGIFTTLLFWAEAALIVGFVALIYWAYKSRSVRLALGAILAIYGVLLAHSYHCLLLAERVCMPGYTLGPEHLEREVVFEVFGWGLAYKSPGSYWEDPGNPVITVDLLGRVDAAEPAYIMDAVNKYQGSRLQP